MDTIADSVGLHIEDVETETWKSPRLCRGQLYLNLFGLETRNQKLRNHGPLRQTLPWHNITVLVMHIVQGLYMQPWMLDRYR